MHHAHHEHYRHHRHRWQRGMGFAALIIVGVAAVAWVVMQLWNALLPELFGWHAVTFFQALGLLALSKVLFGGWHRRGHGRGWHHDHHGRDHQLWTQLSDAEREQLRARFRHRCCGVDKPDETSAESEAS